MLDLAESPQALIGHQEHIQSILIIVLSRRPILNKLSVLIVCIPNNLLICC